MEANFVGDAVAENLKCIVCLLVLKDPVLIIDCGHRLCKLCFQSVRDYAAHDNNPLLCPYDRQNVSIDKVVNDIGVRRMVMDLQVFCDNKSEGCVWSGELRHLKDHVDKQCSVTSLKKFMESVETRLNQKDTEMLELQARLSLKEGEIQKLRTRLFSKVEKEEIEILKTESGKKFDEMEERLKVLEEKLLEKEEEVTSLMNFVESVEARLNQKDAEMQELQARLSLKEGEIQKLRTRLFSKVEMVEIEILRTESGKKFDEMEESLRVLEENLLEKEEELAIVKYEISGLRVRLARAAKGAISSSGPEPKKRKTRSRMIDEENENQQMLVVNMDDSATGLEESVESIKQEYKEMDKKIALLNFKLVSVCKELSVTCAQFKGVEGLEGKVNQDMSTKNDSFNQAASSSSIKSVAGRGCGVDCEHCAEIKILKEKVMNVHTYIPNERTVFVWKIRNYAYYEELGEQLDSPKFYSDISGHCCFLNLIWDTNKDLGVYLSTDVGSGVPDEPFAKQVRFSSVDKNGKTRMSPNSITYADDYIIRAGQQSSMGQGFKGFLKQPTLKDFIIDDVLTIKCELTE